MTHKRLYRRVTYRSERFNSVNIFGGLVNSPTKYLPLGEFTCESIWSYL